MAKNCPPSLNSTLSNSVVIGGITGPPPNAPHQHKYMNSKRKYANKYSSMAGGHASYLDDHNNYLHLNSLWSIWYGVLLTLFQGYLAVHGAYRFLGCSLIPWKIEPVAELNLQIVLSGVVFILLPLFFTSAVFKVGNLANDGIKLATDRKSHHCSITPADGLEEEASGGTFRALWTHGGPTAAFVHIVIAMCLLLPRLLLEAKIIENGLLPKENIWQTELDFIIVNRRNLVMQSIVSAPYKNISIIDETGYDDDYFNDTMYTAVNNNNNNILEKNIKMKTVHKSKEFGNNSKQRRLFDMPDLIKRVKDDYNIEEDNERRGDDNNEFDIENVAEDENDKYNGRRYSIKNKNEVLMTDYPSTASTATLITTDTSGSSSTLQTISSTSVPSKTYDKSWDELGTLSKHNSLSSVSKPTMTTTTNSAGTTTSNSKSISTTMAISTIAKLPTTELTTIATATKTTTDESVKQTTSGDTVNTSAENLNITFVDVSTVSMTTTITTRPTKAHIPHQKRQQNNNHHHHHLNKNVTRKHNNRQHHHRQRGHNSRRYHARTTTTIPPSLFDFEDKLDNPSSGKSKSYANYFDDNDDDDDEINDLGRARAYLPPEIVASPQLVTSNFEIIETRREKSSKKVKRMADDTELQVEIEPEYLIGVLPDENKIPTSNIPDINSDIEKSQNDSGEHEMISTSSEEKDEFHEREHVLTTATNFPDTSFPVQSISRLDGFSGMLQIFFGIDKPIDVSTFAQPPSAEFVNLVFALLVWCVRYPAVFWNTTKPFATIFSIQMITSALDILFGYMGTASLYKYQIYSEAMPIHNPDLILNGVVTLSLYLLSTVLVLTSSMIMYLYGHGRLAAKMRDRSSIILKASETWIYFAHCASLCFVLALAVVKAPLLNDLSATYKNSLHCPTFLSALISVVNLLLWILIWLGLTFKRRWSFKLPPVDIYGLNKATTQPLLMASYRGSIPSSGSSSSSSAHASDQKGLISNTTTTSTDGGGGGGCGSLDGGMVYNPNEAVSGGTNGCDDDIYWPKLGSNSPKLKVTFNEVTSMSDDGIQLIDDCEQQPQQQQPQQQQHENTLSECNKRNTSRGAQICFTGTSGEIDDGEYATLRATVTAATIVGNAHSKPGNVEYGGCGKYHDVKILSFDDDELPPPPPPHNFPMGHTSNSINAPIATITGIVGDYANCSGVGAFGSTVYDDNISEEGKLLESVRDDSITYASTRELDPPQILPPPPLLENNNNNNNMSSNNNSNLSSDYNRREPQALPANMQLSSPNKHLVSPLAPVTVTVHTNEAHIHTTSTPRVLRRFDSGVLSGALTPHIDSMSIAESTKSPPERAPSESSSGIHSSEERDIEVVIRPRVGKKPPAKLPQPPIEEEPYGRCTNMRMSSFVSEPTSARISGIGAVSSSSTLPLTRSTPEQKLDFSHCSTMPLPVGCHSHSNTGNGYSSTSAQSMMQQPQNVSTFKSIYANSSVAMAGANATTQQQQLQKLQQHLKQKLQHQGLHTTLPNGVRYSNPQHLLRHLPHVSAAAESPYGHLGLGAGHHTFAKLLNDPIQGTAIPEDRDSANYSMNSDYETNLYATANHMH